MALLNNSTLSQEPSEATAASAGLQIASKRTTIQDECCTSETLRTNNKDAARFPNAAMAMAPTHTMATNNFSTTAFAVDGTDDFTDDFNRSQWTHYADNDVHESDCNTAHASCFCEGCTSVDDDHDDWPEGLDTYILKNLESQFVTGEEVRNFLIVLQQFASYTESIDRVLKNDEAASAIKAVQEQYPLVLMIPKNLIRKAVYLTSEFIHWNEKKKLSYEEVVNPFLEYFASRVIDVHDPNADGPSRSAKANGLTRTEPALNPGAANSLVATDEPSRSAKANGLTHTEPTLTPGAANSLVANQPTDDQDMIVDQMLDTLADSIEDFQDGDTATDCEPIPVINPHARWCACESCMPSTNGVTNRGDIPLSIRIVTDDSICIEEKLQSLQLLTAMDMVYVLLGFLVPLETIETMKESKRNKFMWCVHKADQLRAAIDRALSSSVPSNVKAQFIEDYNFKLPTFSEFKKRIADCSKKSKQAPPGQIEADERVMERMHFFLFVLCFMKHFVPEWSKRLALCVGFCPNCDQKEWFTPFVLFVLWLLSLVENWWPYGYVFMFNVRSKCDGREDSHCHPITAAERDRCLARTTAWLDVASQYLEDCALINVGGSNVGDRDPVKNRDTICGKIKLHLDKCENSTTGFSAIIFEKLMHVSMTMAYYP